MRELLVLIIKIYQNSLSLIMPYKCRFYPTCSNYAIDALSTHGIVKALWLILKRLLKCHPYSKQWGYDPVPKSTK